MRIKIVFFVLTLITIMLLAPSKKPVFAVIMEEIHAEIKCPDHDRPEILSFVDRLIKEGKTKEEILDAVGDQFGIGVLVNPSSKKIGIMPFLVPTLGLAIALIFVFIYIEKWVARGKKVYEEEKEILKESLDIQDYEKRFEEEYEKFKKEGE